MDRIGALGISSVIAVVFCILRIVDSIRDRVIESIYINGISLICFNYKCAIFIFIFKISLNL